MNKSTQISADRQGTEIDHRYQYVPSEHTPIRNTFERIRTQLAQEAEQKSRPVSRLYSGFRAVKALYFALALTTMIRHGTQIHCI